jgi:hypothetical protein
MKRKLIFCLIATLLLTPWPVAYAYDNPIAGSSPLHVEAAEPAAMPKLNAFGNAIGGVTAGDLFHIDSSNNTLDTLFTLYITNTDELIQNYRYMNLNIGIYVQTGIDQWEKVTIGEGEMSQDTYITMHNGLVNFIIPGYGKYKVTIDKGCFYCYGRSTDTNTAVPKFYLTSS